jgi:hypothetical protein
MATREVDKKNAADLRAKTIQALTSAGMSCGGPDDGIKIPLGPDLRTWLSLSIEAGSDEDHYRELADLIVAALAAAGLHLVLPMQPQSHDAVEHLTQGYALYVEPVAAATGETTA